MTSYVEDLSQVIGRKPLNLTLRPLLILLCIALALLKAIDPTLRRRYHARRAKELGCLPVQRIRRNRMLLGVDNVYRLGDGAVNTWMESKFGASYYVTTEP